MANITSTQQATLLLMLENNLELDFEYYDDDARNKKETELKQYISSAISFIEREGIVLELDNIDDCMLVSMYASWLYTERKNSVVVMPRMLRWNLNNRLFSQKVNV